MSGASLRWLLAMALGALAAIPIAWTYILRDYQKDRILSFLNPAADTQGAGWQVSQSQIDRRLRAAPRHGPHERHASRAASSCRSRRATSCSRSSPRSSGFIGALVVFLLFGPSCGGSSPAPGVARPVRPAVRRRASRRCSCSRCSSTWGWSSGIMPVTGIPLPFISHGGASLVSLAIGLGIDPEHQHPPAPRRVVSPAAARPCAAGWPLALAAAAALGALAQPALARSRVPAARATPPSRPPAPRRRSTSLLGPVHPAARRQGRRGGHAPARPAGRGRRAARRLHRRARTRSGSCTPGETALVFAEIGVVSCCSRSASRSARTTSSASAGRRSSTASSPWSCRSSPAFALGPGARRTTRWRSFFVGLALAATSIGITSRVLRDMGVLDRQFAKVVIGAALVDDILALVLIGLATGAAEGDVTREHAPRRASPGIGLVLLGFAAARRARGLPTRGVHLAAVRRHAARARVPDDARRRAARRRDRASPRSSAPSWPA